MHAEDLDDSMPSLPPPKRFAKGDEVVCVDDSHSGGTIKVGKHYVIDADYGDVKGKQLVYIEGDSDNCPWAASRFKLARGHFDAISTEALEAMGIVSVKVPASPIANQQDLLTGASEKLSLTDQAVFENLMDAESRGAELPADNVTLPKHYARFKIEPIRFICDNGLNFFQGNIVKYTLRHDAKNGLEDISKAIRYAQMYYKFLSGDTDWWKAGK